MLVGHSGSGKTTLVEALALTAGAVNRPGRVEDGTTLSDHDEIEHRQGRSVQLSLVPVEWGGIKINVLDTPGRADFVGELRAGLRAADAALFVVSAADGVDGATRMVWDECAAVGMPRALVVTHLESGRSDFEEMTAVCREAFGGDDPDAVLPLYLPLRDGPRDDSGGSGGSGNGSPAVTGLIGLLSQQVYDYSSGTRVAADPEPGQLPLIEEARNRLIEGIIAESEDETLMDRYLAGEDIDLKTLTEDLERAVARGTFHPVLAAAPPPPEPGRASAPSSCWSWSPAASRPRRSARPWPSPPRRASRGRRSPATPGARWPPRSSRPPPTRTWAGSAWSGCSPGRCGPTRPCTSPGTAWPTADTRTTTWTSASAPSPRPSAHSSARWSRPSPGTWRAWPS